MNPGPSLNGRRSNPGNHPFLTLSLSILLFLAAIACGATTPAPVLNPSQATDLPTQASATQPPAFTPTFTYTPSPIPLPIRMTSIVPLESATPLPSLPLPAAPSSSSTLVFTFLDVGQGDSILVQTPNGGTVLIDGGDGGQNLDAQLRSLGVQRIDLMVATHPHADHIGGLVEILNSLPVAQVVTNGQSHDTQLFEKFLDGILASNAEYIEARRGDVLSLDGIQFEVLNPGPSFSSELNENSVVLRFNYGAATFLLMGDSGTETEAALAAHGITVKADILKVGHHASTTGSSTGFLSQVAPAVALYSAGIGNSYGLPSQSTLAALAAIGAQVYGTDTNGTIKITVDQQGYTVDTVRNTAAAVTLLPAPTYNANAPTASGLEILSVTSPVFRGSYITVTAKTSPNASCSIQAVYKSGPSSAQGLEPRNADANGSVSWTWKVGSRTTPGVWPIHVTCNGLRMDTTHEVK